MPEIESALTVMGVVPLEVCWVTPVPSETLPDASEVALAPNAGVAGLICKSRPRSR